METSLNQHPRPSKPPKRHQRAAHDSNLVPQPPSPTAKPPRIQTNSIAHSHSFQPRETAKRALPNPLLITLKTPTHRPYSSPCVIFSCASFQQNSPCPAQAGPYLPFPASVKLSTHGQLRSVSLNFPTDSGISPSSVVTNCGSD